MAENIVKENDKGNTNIETYAKINLKKFNLKLEGK